MRRNSRKLNRTESAATTLLFIGSWIGLAKLGVPFWAAWAIACVPMFVLHVRGRRLPSA